MARTGRKPLAAGHVEHLQGSDHARLRLKLILECMLGNLTVAAACEQLGIGEARFHAMRSQWLQEALELLEPRRTGRPPQRLASDELLERVAQLETEKRDLEQQLHLSEAREQVVAITAATSPSPSPAAMKKTDRRRRRCRARRRPR
jgi:hypothetical protein